MIKANKQYQILRTALVKSMLKIYTTKAVKSIMIKYLKVQNLNKYLFK